MNKLIEDIRKKEVIVIVGTGGVGKTTISSAIGIVGAMEGKKTLVMTVDPAKRLADALKISLESPSPVRISVDSHSFDAFMVDLRKSADEIINRFSPSQELAEKIKNHKFYQQARDFLLGSHEYASAELLYRFWSMGEYELIVLDTPPARHALEFLEAPSKVMDFLKSKVISKFLRTYLAIGKVGINIAKRGFGGIFSLIEKLTGIDLLIELSEFLLYFEGMYERFTTEAEEVIKLLKSNKTGFYLITSPVRERIQEMYSLYNGLRDFGVKRPGLIVNRVNPFLETAIGNVNTILEKKLAEFIKDQQKGAEEEKKIIEHLKKRYTTLITIPEIAEDINSVEGLKKVVSFLLNE